MVSLQRKTVLITGGAQGIGKAIVREMLQRDWAVILVDMDREAAEETLAEYRCLGELFLQIADVADEAAVKYCVANAIDRFGRLDGLVNNAGIANPYNGPVEALTLADWNRMVATNLTGCFLTVKYATPHLRENKGAIVNIASTRALQSEANTEAYSAAKGGLVSLSRALAVSLGPAIRVNCISPGWIDTSSWRKQGREKPSKLRDIDHLQHPAGRVGMPQDIASLTGYLLSDAAAFVTGQNLVADGGMTCKMIYAED